MTGYKGLCLNAAMATKQQEATTFLQNSVIRLTRVHFWLIAVYAAVIIAADAGQLIARELVWQRWAVAGILLVVNTAVWFFARANLKSITYYRSLIFALILFDIVLATFAVYTERGMSSRGVALYAIPIMMSATLLNRTAIFGTAALTTAAYVVASTRYFYVYFNEGYKLELYTTLAFYSASFFILAAILWIVVTPDRQP